MTEQIINSFHVIAIYGPSLTLFIFILKTQQNKNLNTFRQTIDEVRFRNDRLEEQLNDFSELHQHEVTNIKQVKYFLETGLKDSFLILDSHLFCICMDYILALLVNLLY